MKIKITADSVVDMPNELLAEFNVDVLPLITVLGDVDHYDGIDVNSYDLIEYYNKTKTLPKTAARSPEAFKEFFEKYLNNGYDAVIHFDISASMSLSHANACEAAAQLENVYVVDSQNLSTGVALSVLYACDLVKAGETDPNVIVEKVNKRLPAVQASFMVDRLEWLHKGGRCSSIVYLGANMLGIKPCIEVKNGKMSVARKYVGKYEKVMFKYINETLRRFPCPDKTRAFITHPPITYAGLEDSLVEYVKSLGIFENVYDTMAGCTITSHCGANTIGILYINDGEKLSNEFLNSLKN